MLVLRILAISTLLLMAATPSRSAAAEFRVGAVGDAACTHTSLLAALFAAVLNGAGLDTIKIANNQTYTGVNLAVSGHSVRFEGGYATCASATPSGRTILSGSTGLSTAISTSGSGGHVLELVNIEIANSPSGGSASRLGGGLRVTGDYEVVLRNTRIRNNVAARGGGIYVYADLGTRLILDTPLNAIFANVASISGGGLYCDGPAQIELRGGAAAVYQNSAQNNGTDPDEGGTGGGITLLDGCSLLQSGGGAASGVYDNVAVQYGGGYYLRNLARLRLIGTAQGPARVIDNRVSLVTGGTPGAGGGIAIRDPAGASSFFSEALAENAWIDGNYAWQGSGVALLGGGRFFMRRTLNGAACHDARYCSSLSFNGMDGSTIGARAGALWAGYDATVEITGTYIEGNSATVGSAFWTNGTARTTLDSVVLSGNFGATTLIDARDLTGPGALILAWSTVTGNSFTGANGRIISANQSSANTLQVYGSLLGEPLLTGVLASQLRSDCVLRDPAMQPVGSGGTVTRQGTLAAPYGLTAPASGNFHLANGNVVPVDWCDASLAPRLRTDIAGSTQVIDAVRANLHGIHDLGAHEFPDNDRIFANGFQ